MSNETSFGRSARTERASLRGSLGIVQESTRFDEQFPGVVESIRAARRACTQWSNEHAGDPALAENVALVVSELATNAVQAAPGQPFGVSIAWDGAKLELTVRSVGSAELLPPRPWTTPDGGEPRGRGLAIVDALASEVEVHGDHGSLTVGVLLRDPNDELERPRPH